MLIAFSVFFIRHQFFCFLLIVLVAEIATGVYAILNKDQLYKMTRDSIKKSIQEEYGVINSRSDVFDTFQAKVRNIFVEIYFR